MPTNEAFTNLGNGILESLLLPPNLDKLRQAGAKQHVSSDSS